jgi:hypothetical protein
MCESGYTYLAMSTTVVSPDLTDPPFDEVMQELSTSAGAKSFSRSGKLVTKGRTVAHAIRKVIPKAGVSFAIAHIPVVGPTLSAGSGLVLSAIRDKRKSNKALNVIYRSYATPDSTLSVSDVKTVMKDLQIKANLLDSNLTKQKAEIESLQASLVDLDKEAPNFQTWSDRFSKAGYHYFRVLHYNEKVADLIDALQQRLDYCTRYVKQCDSKAVETLPQLRAVYTDGMRTIDSVESPLLGMRARSSSR